MQYSTPCRWHVPDIELGLIYKWMAFFTKFIENLLSCLKYELWRRLFLAFKSIDDKMSFFYSIFTISCMRLDIIHLLLSLISWMSVDVVHHLSVFPCGLPFLCVALNTAFEPCARVWFWVAKVGALEMWGGENVVENIHENRFSFFIEAFLCFHRAEQFLENQINILRILFSL